MDQKEVTDSENKTNIVPFVTEVARYFMDFLETDFHKVRNPKRQIKYRNKDNLQVCIDLTKYSKYSALVWQTINSGYKTDGSGFNNHSINELKKNTHTLKVTKTLIQLVEEQISRVSQVQIDELVSKFESEIFVACRKHEKDSLEAINQSLAGISRVIKEEFVSGFITNIEEPIQKLTHSVINSVYQVEEDLVDIIIEPFEAIVTTIVNYKILGIETEVDDHIQAIFNVDDIKNKLFSFFRSFDVSDLFIEVTELVSNKTILEKQECYLYLCDITYKNNTYPIFYIPVQIDKSQNGLSFIFDPLLYINKRAISFILQDIASEKEQKRTLRLFSERIMYLSEMGEHLIGNIDEALKELVAYFGLDPYIDIYSSIEQQSKSGEVKISNKCYLALFDKADESLVNDYEEILEKIKEGGDDLAGSFQILIDDFITTNPKSYTLEIDDSWDSKPYEEKLVRSSPVPLNAEQRKILSAARKKGCKYITVEGPPGTGKSHTITSIICDAILDNKSILVLSDKKEALDVVENKITETMNKVRISEDFQNPILRLGKSGNTYTKILSTPSMEKIKEHFKATKNLIDEINQDISNKERIIKGNLQNCSLTYKEIKLKEISYFEFLEKYIHENEIPIDFDELCKSGSTYENLSGLFEQIEFINDRLGFDNSILINLFKKLYVNNISFKCFRDFVKYIKIVTNISNQLGKYKSLLRKIHKIDKNTITNIDQFIEDCEVLRFGFIGYFINYKKAQRLAIEFNRKIPNSIRDIQHKLQDLRTISNILQILAKKQETCEIKYNISFDFDFLLNTHKLLTLDMPIPVYDDYTEIIKCLDIIEYFIESYKNTADKLKLSNENFLSLLDNNLLRMSDEQVNNIVNYFKLKDNITTYFNQLPIFNFNDEKNAIEKLVTTQMTYKVDERIINFYENNRSDSKALAGVISKKQKFDKSIFDKLKNAFPCILAGIRDFAEYIPLESDIFDIVIIDEASQVSIAQALPALLRGKKIIVFGDKLQFSNIKSAQARSVINQEYLNSVKEVFTTTISKDNIQIEKLDKFNIKTSILEFFERISNHSIMLKKHFRGYSELISYSNKYFYDDCLQAIKIRVKPPEEIIKFTHIEHDGRIEEIENTNILEIESIIKEVERIYIEEPKSSIGIITPHTNQQKLLSNAFQKHSNFENFTKTLKLKIMTFDTCQGEERDIIIYSMVANPISDKLWGVFIKNRESVDRDGDGSIKLQRLNVGFSRAKECMHFFISKAVEEFTGSIREALQHYKMTLNQSRLLPSVKDTDQNSPMESKVLHWIQETSFFKKNNTRISLFAQFPIGVYLKQLDKSYIHPDYRVDFFMVYKDETGRQYNIIIEYDGFEYHFNNDVYVNEFNYNDYYNDDDIYREKVLESYGYIFLRINRFNVGKEPIDNLNKRIEAIVSENTLQTRKLINSIHSSISGLQEGNLKECLKCKSVKHINEFKDSALVTGYGRYCTTCKSQKNTTTLSAVKSNKATDTLCPKCNSVMMIRERKRDQHKFLGCSKYPLCSGTREYIQDIQSE